MITEVKEIHKLHRQPVLSAISKQTESHRILFLQGKKKKKKGVFSIKLANLCKYKKLLVKVKEKKGTVK